MHQCKDIRGLTVKKHRGKEANLKRDMQKTGESILYG